jgi:hypothetical protein
MEWIFRIQYGVISKSFLGRFKVEKKVERLHQLIENKVKPSRKGSAASSVREDRDRGH